MLFAIITDGLNLKGLFTNAKKASKYVNEDYENDAVDYETEIFAVDGGETIQLESEPIAFFSIKEEGQKRKLIGNDDYDSTENFEYEEDKGLKHVFVAVDEEGFFSVFYSERKAREYEQAIIIYKVKVNHTDESLLLNSECVYEGEVEEESSSDEDSQSEPKSLRKRLQKAIFSANLKIFESGYTRSLVESKNKDFIKYIKKSFSRLQCEDIIENIKNHAGIISDLGFEFYNTYILGNK